MTTLEEASNIGPVLAGELRRAGFESLEDLRDAGYIEAVRRLRLANPERDCANSALAIAGAIAGVRWTRIPGEARRRIGAEANAAVGSAAAPPPAIT